jgi:hypothetical protein
LVLQSDARACAVVAEVGARKPASPQVFLRKLQEFVPYFVP